MRNIKLNDPYSEKTIRMCEKHFAHYEHHLVDAARGGTSYIVKKTHQRGCDICNKSEKESVT